MPKIAFIGAGSIQFTRALCGDVLLVPALQGSTISLMDIDPHRLGQARDLVQRLIDARVLTATVEATTDRRAAVTGADYVVTTFQQGGLEAYRLDIQIPQRHGVEQCVGDTLGPGGIFRGLRTIPVLLDLCRDLDEVAPHALLLNYVNPMAINCWAVSRGTGRPVVGLCHSVQGTSEMLAKWLEVPYDELSYLCAGINHQAFFLELRRGKEDLYPRLREAVHSPELRGLEPVRIELMEQFGYFFTESSAHATEYLPYYRKNRRMVDEELAPRFTDKEQSGWFDMGRTGGYLKNCEWWAAHADWAFQSLVDGSQSLPSERTHEYGSYIIEAIQTGQPVRINGNLPNTGLIDNLPAGCCVEIPCLVDSTGVHGVHTGTLPPQLAALNRTNINVQELVVEAALTGSVEAVHHAVMLDPLTGAVCTLPQIRALTAELLTAQAGWLPQFAGRIV